MVMMYGGGAVLFWVWPLLLVGGVALLVWAVVRASATGTTGAARPADPAREILRERFARGEITEDQLRQGLRALDER
jgi:putative membrane protein